MAGGTHDHTFKTISQKRRNPGGQREEREDNSLWEIPKKFGNEKQMGEWQLKEGTSVPAMEGTSIERDNSHYGTPERFI